MSELATIKSFEVSLSKQDLEQTFKVLNTMVEEVTINLDVEGMSIKTMDRQHVCLIDIAIPNSMFEKYNVNDKIFFGIRLDNILKVIKEFNNEDMITIKTGHDNQNNEIIKLTNHELSYTVKLEEVIESNVPLPKIPYDALISFEGKDLKRYLNKLKVSGEYIRIESNESKCILESNDDNGNCIITLEKGMPQLKELRIKNNSEARYSLEYLIPYLKAMTKNYTHSIEYSNQKPLRIDSKIFSVGRCHFYLAPRVDC